MKCFYAEKVTNAKIFSIGNQITIIFDNEIIELSAKFSSENYEVKRNRIKIKDSESPQVKLIMRNVVNNMPENSICAKSPDNISKANGKPWLSITMDILLELDLKDLKQMSDNLIERNETKIRACEKILFPGIPVKHKSIEKTAYSFDGVHFESIEKLLAFSQIDKLIKSSKLQQDRKSVV